MRGLQDLSNEALDEYKKLLDSDLFTQEELDLWVAWMSDYPIFKAVGLSQRKTVDLTGRSESTLMNWRKQKIIKATPLADSLIYDANNLIKIMKIDRVEKGKIIWRK